VIDETRAQEITAALLGRPADDPQQPWSLHEFPQGWLINRTAHLTEEYAGAAAYVIEKATGRVLCFPSFVPTPRILRDYDAIVDQGYPENIDD